MADLVGFVKKHPKSTAIVGGVLVIGIIGSQLEKRSKAQKPKTAEASAPATPNAEAPKAEAPKAEAPKAETETNEAKPMAASEMAGSDIAKSEVAPAVQPPTPDTGSNVPAGQKPWLSYPLLERNVLWPIAGEVPGNDEFERNANKQKRAELAGKVRETTYLYRATDEELGEYDFKKGAFPVSYSTVARDGTPIDDKVAWSTCVCNPRPEPEMMDGVKTVNQTHEWTIYRWGEAKQVVWLPVPEAEAQAFAKKHRGHVDVNLLVRVTGSKEDKSHYYTDGIDKQNASTGGVFIFKSLGPMRVTGDDGALLLDTMSKFPNIK